MINFKPFKWSYAIVILSALGLSSCYMDGQNPQQFDSKAEATVTQNQTKAVHKTSGSPEPIQQVAPGPKRKAAPPIPVM